MNIDFIGMNLNDISTDVKDAISYLTNDYQNKRYKEIVLTLLDILDSVEHIENELLKED